MSLFNTVVNKRKDIITYSTRYKRKAFTQYEYEHYIMRQYNDGFVITWKRRGIEYHVSVLVSTNNSIAFDYIAYKQSIGIVKEVAERYYI